MIELETNQILSLINTNVHPTHYWSVKILQGIVDQEQDRSINFYDTASPAFDRPNNEL